MLHMHSLVAAFDQHLRGMFRIHIICTLILVEIYFVFHMFIQFLEYESLKIYATKERKKTKKEISVKNNSNIGKYFK